MFYIGGMNEEEERIGLSLRKESWATIFETLHRKETKVESYGNFWAAIQYLEQQFEDQMGKESSKRASRRGSE